MPIPTRRAAVAAARTVAVATWLAAAAIAPVSAQGNRTDESPRPWIGVQLGREAAIVEDAEGEPVRTGVRIDRVVLDAPAMRAGLRAGDVVLAVDGASVASSSELVARVARHEPGASVQFRIDRRGRERDIDLRLGAWPQGRTRLRVREGWVGLRAIELTPDLQAHFGAPEDHGVMISEIAESSPAWIAGFSLGDVLYAIDGEPVRNVAEFESRVAGGGVENELEFTVMRSGVEIVLEAEIIDMPEDGGFGDAERRREPRDRRG